MHRRRYLLPVIGSPVKGAASPRIELFPMAVLLLPVERLASEVAPTAVLLLPVIESFAPSPTIDQYPMVVLKLPMVFG